MLKVDGAEKTVPPWTAGNANPFLAAGATSRWSRVFSASAQVVAFCLLTALLAQVRVPVPGTPVPATLQTLAVLLAGMALSPGRAAAAMTLYVAAGWAMLAAGAQGPGWFAAFTLNPAGPTGGFLVGFVVAAAVVSAVRGRRSDGCRLAGGGRRIARLTLAGAAGTVVVFAFGAAWYDAFAAGSWSATWAQAVSPFVPSAVVKLALAVAIVRGTEGRMERSRHRRRAE